MERGRRKRSLDRREESSVAVYQLTESEEASLRQSARERPWFKEVNDRDCTTKEVDGLDRTTKMAVLKASAFVVSLVSFSGKAVVTQGCGTIIETDGNINTVITSLNLIRQPVKEGKYVSNNLLDTSKIVIRSPDQNSYIGEVLCYDYHYNLLVLKFKSNRVLSSAKLALIEDDVGSDTSITLRPHSTKIKSGDPLIIVGRYYWNNYYYKAVSGFLSMKRFRPDYYDCNELLTATCYISKYGDGAPVINISGDVFGIAYSHYPGELPILPMKVATTWWKHYKEYKEPRHLSYGFEGDHLYSASIPFLERFLATFPNINNGVKVDQVLPESFAESAGVLKDDVIVKCDGTPVKSFLELWGLMWDKVGHAVELEVARVGVDDIQVIPMDVGEASKVNKWRSI